MLFLNYIYCGTPNWEATFSPIIRSALSERRATSPPKHLYQKLLVLVWSLMMLVLICAYRGDLTAIITKPLMQKPFTNANGMVRQTQMKWGIAAMNDLFISFMKNTTKGKTIRRIYDKTMIFPNNDTYEDECYRSAYQAKKSGNIAAICEITSAKEFIANDFGKTGTCNYFLTEDNMLPSYLALAFQVSCKMVVLYQ